MGLMPRIAGRAERPPIQSLLLMALQLLSLLYHSIDTCCLNLEVMCEGNTFTSFHRHVKETLPQIVLTKTFYDQHRKTS